MVGVPGLGHKSILAKIARDPASARQPPAFESCPSKYILIVQKCLVGVPGLEPGIFRLRFNGYGGQAGTIWSG